MGCWPDKAMLKAEWEQHWSSRRAIFLLLIKKQQKTRAQSNNLEHHLVVTFESWKEAGVFPSSLSSSFPHVSSKNEVFIGSTFHQIRIVGQVLMLWRDYFPAWNTWSFAIAQSRISPLELANHKMVICFGEKSLDFVGSCISPRRMKAFSSWRRSCRYLPWRQVPFQVDRLVVFYLESFHQVFDLERTRLSDAAAALFTEMLSSEVRASELQRIVLWPGWWLEKLKMDPYFSFWNSAQGD